MKCLLSYLVIALFLVSPVFAAEPKTYQVTGPVLDLKDDMIVVQKGTEKWEIGRDKETKASGDLKKGAKVTIHYRMRAASIEVKDGAKKAETMKSEPKKAEPMKK
jgi:hypothetical protein